MLRQLLNFLRSGRDQPLRSDLRYADPSHDPKNRKISYVQSRTKSSDHVFQVERKTKAADANMKVAEESFKNIERIKELTLSCIRQTGREGIATFNLNGCVATKLSSLDLAKKLLGQKWVKDQLYKARNELIGEGVIGYNRQEEVWYIKADPIRDLTHKEQGYLAAQGLGEGWRKIDNELEAVRWLHRSFSPEEFEHFCVAILSSHCGVPVKITEKRPGSGADGGFDGDGTYELEGQTINVALQAKRWSLDAQVGEDHCDRFVGALVKNGWKHGFIVTTALFSERSIHAMEAYKKQGYFIELIDQNRLVKIMMEKTIQPHGFGLHKTDYGLVYINEDILLKAALKRSN